MTSIPPNGPFSSYLVLVRKLDQKYADRGELDPLTWQEVDAQICEDPRLSRGQMRVLHDHCRNRLKLAGSGWG